MDILDETIAALAQHSKPVVPGSCIATNQALRALRLHGRALLPVVEQVLSVTQVPLDDRNRTSRSVRSNIEELLVIYFAIADDNQWDTTPFLSSVPEACFDLAVCAIGREWGTNNAYRRRVIPKQLYDCVKSRLPADNWLLLTLKRYLVVGMLTFDRNNPGCLHPTPRKYSSINDMFMHAKAIRKAVSEISD